MVGLCMSLANPTQGAGFKLCVLYARPSHKLLRTTCVNHVTVAQMCPLWPETLFKQF